MKVREKERTKKKTEVSIKSKYHTIMNIIKKNIILNKKISYKYVLIFMLTININIVIISVML
jgi:DNA-directed RNA polymerase subunit L